MSILFWILAILTILVLSWRRRRGGLYLNKEIKHIPKAIPDYISEKYITMKDIVGYGVEEVKIYRSKLSYWEAMTKLNRGNKPSSPTCYSISSNFRGKMIFTEGIVHDVKIPHDEDKIIVLIRVDEEHRFGDIIIIDLILGPEWRNALRLLKKGNRVSAVGRLQKIHSSIETKVLDRYLIPHEGGGHEWTDDYFRRKHAVIQLSGVSIAAVVTCRSRAVPLHLCLTTSFTLLTA